MLSNMVLVTSASGTPPHLVDVDVDFPAPRIVRTTLVFQEGQNPLNRFTIQRVREVSLGKQRPFLLLSSFNPGSRGLTVLSAFLS